MKFIINIIVIVFLMSQFSCSEDYLDKTDPTKLSSNKFYSNEEEITTAVNGVYGLLQNLISDQYIFNELITDNTTVDFDPDSRSQANAREAFDFWTLNPAVNNIKPMYEQYYNMLHNINNTLSKLDNSNDIADVVINESKGQLLFLRAYLYFELTQYFGDIVLITEPLDNPSEAWEYTKESQDNVCAQIEDDLTNAVSLLPVSYDNNNTGRATKGAALTLLGKVYLTWKQYADATESLMQVLSLGYDLLSDYADVFDPINKNSVESIFEVQFQGGNTLGEHSDFIYSFAPRLSEDAITGWPQSTPRGYNIPTKDLIAAYEEDDLRKDASVGLDFVSSVTKIVVPYIKKYAHPHTIYGQTDDNWPVLRYADVLLMLAEAINEQNGPTAEAYNYLNQVRERAGLTALSGLDQQSFQDKVLGERRVELAFENWRWFDLKRTNSPAELIQFLNAYGAREMADPTIDRQGIPYNNGDYVIEEFEMLFPFPSSEIIVNEDLGQNPGYY